MKKISKLIMGLACVLAFAAAAGVRAAGACQGIAYSDSDKPNDNHNEGGSEGGHGHGQHDPEGGTQGEADNPKPGNPSNVSLFAMNVSGGDDNGGGVEQGGSDHDGGDGGYGHGDTPGDPGDAGSEEEPPSVSLA